MPKIARVQNAFTSGEFDELLSEREDVRFFQLAASRLENVVVMPQGGVTRRGGTRYRATIATTGNVKAIPFAFSTEQTYLLVAYGGNLLVFLDGVLKSTETIPHDSAEIAKLNWTQSLDTLLLFHPDVEPQRVQRQGSDTDWGVDAVPFTNIPNFDYGATGGGVDEVQAIGFTGFSGGDTYSLELDGVGTGPIAYNATAATHAASVQTALRALSNTAAAGLTVVANSDTKNLLVTFAGDDGDREWPLLVLTELATSGIGTVSRVTRGAAEGEPVMSATRGWPRCGTFARQALWLGGISSRPQTIIRSRLGDFYNLDLGEQADAGLMFTADSDEVSAVYQIVNGRFIQFLTSSGEWYLSTSAPSPTSLPMENTSKNGSKEGVRPLSIDGATLFVQGGGAALRENLFEDAEQSYVANDISLLAPHLINEPIATALRRARNTREGDLVVLVNGPTPANRLEDLEGTCTLLTTLRRQNVTAFTRMTTRPGDSFVGAAALLSKELYFLVKREVDGETVTYLEEWDDSLLVDSGVTITTGLPASSVTGADHLEGAEVAIWIDGSYAGTATVVDGEFDLPYEAETEIQYGLAFTHVVETLPYRPADPGLQTRRNTRKRALKAYLNLYRSGDFRIGANGRTPVEAPVRRFGPVLDESMADQLLTGTYEIGPFIGYGPDAKVRIEGEAQFTLQALSYEVAL